MQILIPVRTDRLNTNEDVIYAIENRLEQLQGRKYEVPKLRVNTKVKMVEGAGLYGFFMSCLP